MKRILINIVFIFCFVHGNQIKVDAPKIILQNTPFKITFSGNFSEEDKYHLLLNQNTFSPEERTEKTISFNNITVSKTGALSLVLNQESEKVYEIRKNIVPGWVSVLPPFIAIVFSFATRSVVPSLFIAIWFGIWSMSAFSLGGVVSSLLSSFNIYILNTFIDKDHAVLMLFTLMLGGMVGVVYRNGGMHGIIKHLIKRADTPKKGQISIWLFGLIVFFDDYSNTLIVGNTSRLLCDKLKISRQKLAYIVDSTSAPVATIAIITTWIGFQIGIISDALLSIDGFNQSAYTLFLNSIPYSFYPFLAISLVGLVVGTGKDFGPMFTAEQEAREGIKHNQSVSSSQTEEPVHEDMDLSVKKNIPHLASNAIIPIAVLVVSMFYFVFSSGEGSTLKDILGSSDTFSALMHSTLLSAITAAALSISRGVLTVNETLDAWFGGVKFMLMGLLVLLLAWALADVSKDLQTADYIVSSLGGSIPMNLLPAIIFVIAAITAFGSGSSWGVMAILMPLVIPLTWAVMENHGGANPENYHIMYSSVACVLTGAVWADHCSPISDTTILTSMASGCELMDHVWTQMPYALSAGLAALFLCTLPAGFGMPWWILLILGISSQVIIVSIFGKKLINE